MIKSHEPPLKDAMWRQYSLGLTPDIARSFENYVGKSNEKNKQLLKAAISGNYQHLIVVRGAASLGKTHLLSGALNAFRTSGRACTYATCFDLIRHPREVLGAIAEASLICIDDIDVAFGHRERELSLYDLYNATLNNRQTVILSHKVAKGGQYAELPDLESRLRAGLVIELNNYEDDDICTIVSTHARMLGLMLGERELQYFFARSERRLDVLLEQLGKLEKLSLEKQRKLTVPFIREALEW